MFMYSSDQAATLPDDTDSIDPPGQIIGMFRLADFVQEEGAIDLIEPINRVDVTDSVDFTESVDPEAVPNDELQVIGEATYRQCVDCLLASRPKVSDIMTSRS